MRSMKWIVCLSVLFFSPQGFSQGSLTPPGAPGATMKTLDQIEPRTPLSGATVISQSGSYYLTGPVTNGGITIATDGVVLDLGGFALVGADSGNGIMISNGLSGVIVRNGILRGFDIGVIAVGSSVCRLENLAITDCQSEGIFFDGTAGDGCAGNILTGCTIVGNGAAGIRFAGQNGGRCEYNLILNCTLGGNQGHGVLFDGQNGGQCVGNSIIGTTIAGNFLNGLLFNSDVGVCSGNSLSGCTISGNSSNGVYFSSYSGECSGNSISDCKMDKNGAAGIGFNGICSGNSLSECTVSRNEGSGVELESTCRGNRIAECTIGDNESNGIVLYGYFGYCDGNNLAGCTVSRNGSAGIYLHTYNGSSDGNRILNCVLQGNADQGIYVNGGKANRIEGNHISGTAGVTTYGIYTTSCQDNLIVRNTCIGQTDAFNLDVDDTFGPEITTAGFITNSNPWANFTF